MSNITLLTYIDGDTQEIKSSREFFSLSPDHVAQRRTYHEGKRPLDGKGAFVCVECSEPIFPRLSSPPHFSHYSTSEDTSPCQLRTLESLSAPPSQIYCGEGNLHFFWKHKLLEKLSETEGVTQLKMEKQAVISDSDGAFSRRFPDLQFCYDEWYFALEVQNSWLSPSDIVARERFYSEKGWILIWLVVDGSLNQQTERDIRCNTQSDAFLCSLNANLLNEWESSKNILFQVNQVKNCIAQNSPPFVSIEWESVTYNLSDCLLAEDSLELSEYSIKGIQQDLNVAICRAIAPRQLLPHENSDSNPEAIRMKSAIKFHFGLDDIADENAHKLFRLIMSFATNKVMFATPWGWDVYWDWRLGTKKWQRYLPLVMVSAAAFDSRIKSNDVLVQLADAVWRGEEAVKNEDVLACGGKDWGKVKHLFPAILRYSEYLLSHEIAQRVID